VHVNIVSLLTYLHVLDWSFAVSSLCTSSQFAVTLIYPRSLCLLLNPTSCIKHYADDATLSNSPPPAHHHCHPPSHIHCFIPGSNLTFSTNRFHHSLLAPIWTAFSDYTGPDLLYSTVFHF